MSNYRIIIVSKILDASYNNENELYDIINKRENEALKVYVIDNRGNSTFVTKLTTQEIQYTP